MSYSIFIGKCLFKLDQYFSRPLVQGLLPLSYLLVVLFMDNWLNYWFSIGLTSYFFWHAGIRYLKPKHHQQLFLKILHHGAAPVIKEFNYAILLGPLFILGKLFFATLDSIDYSFINTTTKPELASLEKNPIQNLQNL